MHVDVVGPRVGGDRRELGGCHGPTVGCRDAGAHRAGRGRRSRQRDDDRTGDDAGIEALVAENLFERAALIRIHEAQKAQIDLLGKVFGTFRIAKLAQQVTIQPGMEAIQGWRGERILVDVDESLAAMLDDCGAKHVLLDTSTALYERGMASVAALVFVTVIAMPAAQIIGMLYLLLPLRFAHDRVRAHGHRADRAGYCGDHVGCANGFP